MQTRPVRLLGRLAAIGSMVLALTGCPEDAADITQIKEVTQDFDVAPLSPVNFATGATSPDRFVLAAFDTTVVDAFGRSVPLASEDDVLNIPGYDPPFAIYVFGTPASAAEDPRTPLLTATQDITTTGAGLRLFAPPQSGLGLRNFNISGVLAGLPPNTTYTVALVRYGLQVNAELDQAASLLGEPITQPDDLVLLNPNPLGDPNVSMGVGTTPGANTIFAQAGANPFIIGNGSTDAAGASDLGIVIQAATSGGVNVWFASDGFPTSAAAFRDSSMFGRNDGIAYDLPRYNYVVLFEGLGVGGASIARWQTGQDLDLTGQPINNAFITDCPLGHDANGFSFCGNTTVEEYEGFPGPATIPELIAAPGGAGRPDSVTAEFLKLEALDGGSVWQAWLVNRDESPTTMTPAGANYERIAIIQVVDPITGEVISERDSLLEALATSSFPGQLSETVIVDGEPTPSAVKHRLRITDATTGGGASSVGFFTDVLLTIESGPGAVMPSDARPLWFHYTDQNGTPQNFFDDSFMSGTTSFGTFDIADAASSVTFSDADFSASSGFGGVSGDGTIVTVDIRNLPLPPVGFYYEGFLTGSAGNVSMGPLTTLPPDTVSLFDADIDQSIVGVTATGIRFANAFVVLDPGTILSGSDVNLSLFFLTLEAKNGPASKAIADLEVGTLPTDKLASRE